jgi:hypothetical protein
MTRRELGEVTGKCPLCTINTWSSTDSKPSVFPCNIEGCPYEDPKKQVKNLTIPFSSTGSGLAQLD